MPNTVYSSHLVLQCGGNSSSPSEWANVPISRLWAFQKWSELSCEQLSNEQLSNELLMSPHINSISCYHPSGGWTRFACVWYN